MKQDELVQEIKDLFARYGAKGDVSEQCKEIIDHGLNNVLTPYFKALEDIALLRIGKHRIGRSDIDVMLRWCRNRAASLIGIELTGPDIPAPEFACPEDQQSIQFRVRNGKTYIGKYVYQPLGCSWFQSHLGEDFAPEDVTDWRPYSG